MRSELDFSAYTRIELTDDQSLSCFRCPGREATYDLVENGDHREITVYCYPDRIEGSHPANHGCPLGYDDIPPKRRMAPQQENPHTILRKMLGK